MSLHDWLDEIHLIGAGGIGTHALLTLIEQEARVVHLWDDDTVEGHNLPTQFMYRPVDIGTSKVEAAKSFVERQGYQTVIIPHATRVTPSTRMGGIVISGVDSMTSRADIWETVRLDPRIRLYVDARIGADTLQVHALDPIREESGNDYASWIVLDEEVPDLGCITRQNPHSALGVAQVLSAHLTLFTEEGELPIAFLERSLLAESGA